MQRRKFFSQSLKTALMLGAAPSIICCTRSQNDRSSEAMIGAIISEIETLAPELLRTHNVPALAIALVHEGKRVWSRGFGTTSSGRQVDGDTVFECASISKTVFAYAVMKLCEKGIMSLDRPLVTYGISPGVDDPRIAQITARHILSHQSGLQNWRTPEEPLKFHFDPGKGFMYSGEGYFYLQSVLTHLVGKTDRQMCGNFEAGVEVCASDIGEYLEQHVLRPLQMKSSGYLTRNSMKENYANPYNESGEGFSKPPQGPTDMARYAAAGGLLTTVNDYATFITQLFDATENDSHRLSKQSLETMFIPQVKLAADQSIDGATSWALGWAVQERAGGNVVEHSGGQPGYRSLAMVSRDKKSGFVMFTNSDRGGYVIYNEVLGNILNRLLPKA